jgi:hypothetical protein
VATSPPPAPAAPDIRIRLTAVGLGDSEWQRDLSASDD